MTDTDDETVTFITSPSIRVLKSYAWTIGDGSHVGDVVTFTYTVVNEGNVTLDPVSVIDDQLGPITLLATSLAPGATTTGTATLTLTQGLLDAGSQTNTAIATGTPPSGPDVTATSTQTVTFLTSPSIRVVKTFAWTTGDGSHVGDVVTYTYVVTNEGNVTLNPVSVTDDQLGPITLLATTLARGDVTTGTATLTVTFGGPSINLVKTFAWTTGNGAHVGDVATYTYTVTNTGNVTLDPVSVTDDTFGSITLLATSLAPGDSTTGTATLTLTQALLDAGSQTNTATATGTPPSGPDVTDASTRTVTFLTTPSIHLAKTYAWTTGDGSRVGDVVTYTYTVTNTGNVTLDPVSVTDDQLGPITLLATSLAPGVITTGTATLTLTQPLLDAGSITNIATATGTPPSGPDVTDISTRMVTFITTPSIEVIKDFQWTTGDGSHVGDVVTYTYTVTNVGNVTLNSVTLVDDKLGPITLPDTSLAPGGVSTGTATLTLTQPLLDEGSQTNVATATGTPQTGPDATDDATQVVDFLQLPDIGLVKYVRSTAV